MGQFIKWIFDALCGTKLEVFHSIQNREVAWYDAFQIFTKERQEVHTTVNEKYIQGMRSFSCPDPPMNFFFIVQDKNI